MHVFGNLNILNYSLYYKSIKQFLYHINPNENSDPNNFGIYDLLKYNSNKLLKDRYNCSQYRDNIVATEYKYNV